MSIVVTNMGQFGQIEIHVVGQKGNNPLTPDNYDIKEVILLSNLLFIRE